MMKIAVSSKGNTLDDEVDQRFGRCQYFIILDTNDIEDFEFVENPGHSKEHAGGTTAASVVSEKGVEAVVTGNIGPKAERTLSGQGIQIYEANGTVREAVAALKANME